MENNKRIIARLTVSDPVGKSKVYEVPIKVKGNIDIRKQSSLRFERQIEGNNYWKIVSPNVIRPNDKLLKKSVLQLTNGKETVTGRVRRIEICYTKAGGATHPPRSGGLPPIDE